MVVDDLLHIPPVSAPVLLSAFCFLLNYLPICSLFTSTLSGFTRTIDSRNFIYRKIPNINQNQNQGYAAIRPPAYCMPTLFCKAATPPERIGVIAAATTKRFIIYPP